MKTIICTTGTSISINTRINLDRLKGKTGDQIDKIERESIKKAIYSRVQPYLNKIDDLKNISAEIKSLIKIKVEKDDKIVLLSSDTEDGFLCAEVVKYIIKEKFECEVLLKKISGLQANDADRFKKVGLKNLFNELFNLLETHQFEEIILNPTGGYKSIVPYLTIFGMIFNKPVKYIHEDSEELITLVNIPLMMDENLMFKIEDRLKRIEKQGAITFKEWKEGLDYYDSRYDSLIEDDGKYVTLSAVGIILYEKFKKDYPEDLVRDFTDPDKKENKLISQGIKHHGEDKLISISKRLIKSPYVVKILQSCNYQPSSKTYIKPLTKEEAKEHLQNEEIGICMVTDIKTEMGASFLIKTTARNDFENELIARILTERYF